MQNKISVRQICFILLSSSAISKMIVAPAVTSRYARESLWISILINILIDGFFAIFFLFLNDKFDGQTLYSVLERSFGTVVAKIVFSLFTAYFLLRAFIPVMEQKNYIEVALYETLPSITTYLTFFLFSSYFCYKGFKALGRCADVCIWFAALGFTVLTALSVSLTDVTNVMPIIGVPLKDVLLGSKNTAVWYFDSAYILLLLGHFEKTKKYKLKITLSYVGLAVAVASYAIVLYGEFGPLTQRQYFAPIQMGNSNVALTSIGRIDYISGFVYALVSAFANATPLLFASYCLQCVVPFKRKIISPLIVNGVIMLAILFGHDYFLDLFRFISKTLVWGFIVVVYILPLALLFVKKENKPI